MSSSGDLVDEQLLGGTATQCNRDLVLDGLLGVQRHLLGQILGESQGTIGAGDNGDLQQRVSMLQEPAHHSMPRLVQSHRLLLLGIHQIAVLRQASQDALSGLLEVGVVHPRALVTGGEDGGFVADVGDVGAAESRGQGGHALGDVLHVQPLSQRHGLEVHHEDLLTLPDIGLVDGDLTIESPRTQQSRVQDVDPVSTSQHHDIRLGGEPIHLHEQLVQRVLTLIIATPAESALTTLAAHGVDLIDEDDRRGLLASLLKQVAHTGGTHTHEHLHEITAAHGKEGNASFTCHGLRQQGLPRTRRPHQNTTLGDLCPQLLVLLGAAQEIHKLLDLHLGVFQASNISKLRGGLHVRLCLHIGLAD
mmetsp:Transcript_19631/g.47518  ORF Transcript_19631/g.47518 Transcript_19631/m.47518 type:complete len:362 (-) Transcript_19631:881-1966(-)